MPDNKQPVLVVFASDQGPGDALRTAIMSQTGNMLARRGARQICLGENNNLPLPLLTSARAAGGDVELVCDRACTLPDALKDISVNVKEDKADRLNYLAEKADCFIGLPGSLASVSSHYFTIAGLAAQKPMVFLNQNNAYEIVRGFSVDVFAHSFPRAFKNVQFAETVEDMWPRIARLLNI